MSLSIIFALIFLTFFVFVINAITRVQDSVNKLNRSLLLIREHLGIEDPIDHQLKQDIGELIKGKKKIEAVRKYRQLTNEGLKEAYDYVEDLAKELSNKSQ